VSVRVDGKEVHSNVHSRGMVATCVLKDVHAQNPVYALSLQNFYDEYHSLIFVVPAKAGIQDVLDSRFHGNDKSELRE
jgi:hypothetical protein